MVSSGSVLAAVRSASVGMPPDETAAAPFTDGRRLLSHNGRIDPGALPLTRGAESVCDSALLAAYLFADGGDRLEPLPDLLAGVASRDPGASLNVLVHEGHRVLAASWGDPMSYLVEPDGVAVASEPWDDDPRWVDVPDHHLLEVTPDGITLTPLERP